jgi:hypothetical protein
MTTSSRGKQMTNDYLNKSKEKMKSIWCILGTLMVFGCGCDDYAPKHGTPTIEQSKMADMITDVHIIESYIQNIDAKKRDSVKTILYHELFEIYEIDTTEFYKNQRSYYENPMAVEGLYKDVLEKLNEKEKEIMKNKMTN